MAATVALQPPARKPSKAFYAQYLGLSGVLTKPADRVLFLEPESGAVITLSPAEVLRDVVLNGAVAEAMAKYLADMAQGGYAAVVHQPADGGQVMDTSTDRQTFRETVAEVAGQARPGSPRPSMAASSPPSSWCWSTMSRPRTMAVSSWAPVAIR